MTEGKCAQCGKKGDMRIYDCGIQFCSFECQRNYRYKPHMTDETFKYDTPIDYIEIDGGKETFNLTTTDGFYEMYSGYKVILTNNRIFYHKQLKGFKTIASARLHWEAFKKKNNYVSWADSILVEEEVSNE